MEKFLFIFDKEKMNQRGRTEEELIQLKNVLSGFGNIDESYVEPVMPTFTDEECHALKDCLDKTIERADIAEQKLESYAPLIKAYNTMTEADKKCIETLTEENKSKGRAEMGLTQIEQIIATFKETQSK